MAFAVGASGQQSEINVTPLIDVLLVLLIIFMVIVPVMPRGLASQVPQKSKAAQRMVGPVSLRLLGDGTGKNLRYEVDGQAVDSSRLNEVLLASLRVRSDRSVYVAASPDVSYKAVAEVVERRRQRMRPLWAWDGWCRLREPWAPEEREVFKGAGKAPAGVGWAHAVVRRDRGQ